MLCICDKLAGKINDVFIKSATRKKAGWHEQTAESAETLENCVNYTMIR